MIVSPTANSVLSLGAVMETPVPADDDGSKIENVLIIESLKLPLPVIVTVAVPGFTLSLYAVVKSVPSTTFPPYQKLIFCVIG